MKKATVRLTDVSIGYKGRQGLNVVASGITADICQGELTCLLGRNGVGKSTLLRTLSGFQPRLSGSISIEDRELDDYSDRELAQKLGVVLTERPDVQQMTVWDLVALGRSPYTGFWGRLHDDDVQVVAEAIAQVGVEQLRHRLVTTLSDGERQKVMIAKALAQQTPIIFLDEPTASLDAIATEQIKNSIDAIKQGRTVIVISHNIGQIIDSDQLYVLDTGHCVQSGTPAEVYRQGGLYKDIFDASARSMNADKIAETLEETSR